MRVKAKSLFRPAPRLTSAPARFRPSATPSSRAVPAASQKQGGTASSNPALRFANCAAADPPTACKIAADDPAGAEVRRYQAGSWNGRRGTARVRTVGSLQCGTSPAGRRLQTDLESSRAIGRRGKLPNRRGHRSGRDRAGPLPAGGTSCSKPSSPRRPSRTTRRSAVVHVTVPAICRWPANDPKRSQTGASSA